MLDDFEASEVETGETTVFVRRAGTGLPLLLLHGFPQTHIMWRSVAPLLADQFTVVCADLRGYGRSGCPLSTPDHARYAKRAMAQDMVIVMERLGFPHFSVAGTTVAVASPIAWRWTTLAESTDLPSLISCRPERLGTGRTRTLRSPTGLGRYLLSLNRFLNECSPRYLRPSLTLL